jgi:hypothetical protein
MKNPADGSVGQICPKHENVGWRLATRCFARPEESDPMKQIVLAAAASLGLAHSAIAQPRPSTTGMSCNQAAGLVVSRGEIVLGTGGHTYDRFVADHRFCLRGEVSEPVWVPARDTAQCFVGYRCKPEDSWFDR